jgi:hypothetical protein
MNSAPFIVITALALGSITAAGMLLGAIIITARLLREMRS